VCQIKHHFDAEKKSSTVEEVIPIAGDLEKHGGGQFKWDATRLKTEGEGKSEGVKLTLKGGVYEQREQRAVVEFRCKKGTSGLDGEWESEDEYTKAKREEDKKDGDKKDEDKKKEGDSTGFPEKQLKKDNAALIWEGYTREGNVDTLFLTWHTEHACDKAVQDNPPADESSHWGFFTWLIIL